MAISSSNAVNLIGARQSMMQAVTAVPAMATSIIQAALPRIWTVVHGSVPSLQACSYGSCLPSMKTDHAGRKQRLILFA